MADKENVLVFPSAGYAALQTIKCLKYSPLFHVVAGASYGNHAEFIYSDTIIDLPLIKDPAFLSQMKELIRERNIRYVIPTDDTAALFLKEHEEELHVTVVCSPSETANLCRHKKQTFAALAGEPYVPRVYSASELDGTDNYPVFVKPDSSQGSRGACLVKSREELDRIPNLDEMVICEYLPGEEYTVDCFTNRDRELLFCNPRIRTRMMNGITVRGEDVPCDEEFLTVIRGLNGKLHFRGYWFTQLKRDRNGKLKLLEISTRFAGTSAISKGKGVNLPLLSLCDFSGRPADLIVNDYRVVCDKTYIDRYRLGMTYDRVYVDYDDTVTAQSGQAVNPYVIAYLYQCRAKHRRIILVTRHKDTFGEDLHSSFSRLGIAEGLFDEIVELRWNQEKSDFIDHPEGAIFLDNSFAERKKVHDRLKMPVFDITNVDCLFDWRQ